MGSCQGMGGGSLDACSVWGERVGFWRTLELLLYAWAWLRSLTSRLSFGSRNRSKSIGLKGIDRVPCVAFSAETLIQAVIQGLWHPCAAEHRLCFCSILLHPLPKPGRDAQSWSPPGADLVPLGFLILTLGWVKRSWQPVSPHCRGSS